ncbi:uncharacterized protein LOC114301650 isoform X3 [Camellia sinensis]|uniref:uncharacterized protein LOC114301650 isoform X3 n=1 Tax=Camellia sinensis TaxID=4442 RepID=UPI0010360ADF|nr:uncharacterized protein LOC114301650 isoform X3 [Camellia sinensis]
MNRRRLEAPPNDEPYFVSPHLYFENPPPSSSKLSLTQISHSLALSRFFFRAIAISKFLRPNLSATVWLQSRSFSERLQFRSSILSTAVYNLRKTNRILQNLLQLRDFEVRFGTLHLFNQRYILFKRVQEYKTPLKILKVLQIKQRLVVIPHLCLQNHHFSILEGICEMITCAVTEGDDNHELLLHMVKIVACDMITSQFVILTESNSIPTWEIFQLRTGEL